MSDLQRKYEDCSDLMRRTQRIQEGNEAIHTALNARDLERAAASGVLAELEAVKASVKALEDGKSKNSDSSGRDSE